MFAVFLPALKLASEYDPDNEMMLIKKYAPKRAGSFIWWDKKRCIGCFRRTDYADIIGTDCAEFIVHIDGYHPPLNQEMIFGYLGDVHKPHAGHEGYPVLMLV
jgi:hypothetical protein